jgi:hypothetical protein
MQTRLSPGDVEEVLRKLVRPKVSFFHDLNSRSDAGPPFIGWVEGNRFKFRRVITHRNSFLPIVSGRVISVEGGAVVRATLRLAPAVAIVMTLWMTMGAYAAIQRLPRAWQNSDVTGIIVAVGLPIFGLVLTFSGFLPEKRKAVRLLSEAFAKYDPK